MKRILIAIALLALSLSANAQFNEYDVEDFLRGTAWEDSTEDITRTLAGIQLNNKLNFPAVKTGTTAATIFSRVLTLGNGSGDITFFMYNDSLAGTTNVSVLVGRIRAPEVGVVWDTMATFTADEDTASFAFADQGWGDTDLSNDVAIKIVETGNQRNRVGIRVRRWNPR